MDNLKGKLSFFLRSQNADVGPPLATRLGSYFINTSKFCKEFNSFTATLNDYFLVIVYVDIYEQGVYKYKVGGVSVSFLLKVVLIEYKIKERYSGGYKEVSKKAILLEDLYKVTKYKFGNTSDVSLKIVYGVVKSMSILIKKKNV